MTDATFTTLLAGSFTNDYGNAHEIKLIHRSAGVCAAGSVGAFKPEAYLVRITRQGDATFHGKAFSDRFDALDFYNAKIGTVVPVIEVVED